MYILYTYPLTVVYNPHYTYISFIHPLSFLEPHLHVSLTFPGNDRGESCEADLNMSEKRPSRNATGV